MVVKGAAQGAAAGVLATGAMTAVLEAGRRLSGHGQPPRHIVRALLPGGGGAVPRRGENAATAVAHAGFGAAAGALFGAATGRRRPSRLLGAGYALAVMAAGYQGWAPRIGAQPPLHRDRPDRVATLAAAHVVYGWGLAAALRRWRRGR
ncbi:hypothetical protein ACFONH_22195 [Streptomonospora nanhaiensis]|uniref:DUF1440 domain-containing protein n=1 Tax=Streptomonospora nanhaiensis TaxID=1323731 RepID=A0A853BX90_9ACTN|nr:hypothetical protein [Streptomonospora nanhaiensis]MBV2364571.1 hypothetical protein [Streptomonospora nanhaiensis]NYI99077.1 hypothetical protein [Streptomonospora nanhaiensis]